MIILCITPDEKYDYLVAGIIEGLLKKTSIDLYFTSKGNGVPEDKIIKDKEFSVYANKSDYIFILHGKRPGKYYLFNKIKNWNKVVLIDGSELSFNYLPPFSLPNLINEELLNRVGFYFKRECYPQHIKKGIYPLPFTVLDSYLSPTCHLCKDIDILCAFNNLEGLSESSDRISWRVKAVNICRKLRNYGYKILSHPVNSNDYFNTISRSWITIDAFGSGEINARTFQIMSNSSLGFFKNFNVVIPNLLEGEHYIGWDNEKDLEDKLIYYLDNKKKISDIIYNSYDNLLKHHTSENRVDYILSIIN